MLLQSSAFGSSVLNSHARRKDHHRTSESRLEAAQARLRSDDWRRSMISLGERSVDRRGMHAIHSKHDTALRIAVSSHMIR